MQDGYSPSRLISRVTKVKQCPKTGLTDHMFGNDERAGEPYTTERGEEGKIERGRGGEERGEKRNKRGSPGL